MRPAAQLFRKRYYAIDWAMEVDPLLRPQSVDQLLEALRQAAIPAMESVLERLANRLPWNRR